MPARDVAKVVEKLEAARQTHIDRLKEWLRIPSVSTDPARAADVRNAGTFILEELRSAGLRAQLSETARHPVVTAEWCGAERAPTLLIYGHYDVQPPDPLDLWRHGAFTPTEEKLNGTTNLIARGATDDKGQVLALVRGVAGALSEWGSLPVNVKFLIEGEEEIGSPNLEKFIHEHKKELAADVVLVSDGSQFAPGVPALTVGLRGLVYLEVRMRGPNRDLHSGTFGGAVHNPANALCGVIARLKDDKGRVTIPGFYDDVREMSPSERAAMAALPFDESEFRRDLDVAALAGEVGYTTQERKATRPTLDVNGLLSGFTGEGAKTVLPARAMAKISMRLVPDQEPQKIAEAAQAWLRKLAPAGTQMECSVHSASAPVRVPADSRYVKACMRSIEKGFGRAPVFMHEGGSIPVVGTFKQELGIDTILMGLGQNDDNAHSPNEKFNLADYQRGIETMAYFLDELARG